jgi:NAD(P)-dependent dehydrogenase (short-subunit alcohol dehydrogenase family)
MKSFASKVALVTGAGSGMGRYLALLLAKSGADVVICDINEETLNETEAMLKHYNVGVSSHLLDVSDKQAVEALPDKVIERHGKIDLLFNNAGVTVGSSFDTMSESDWDWAMGINLHGVINLTRSFMPLLKQRPEAAIINTSSIFAMIAVANQSVYHASKFAVRGFTESLAKEHRDSTIQVHCVHPGHIGTNIVSNSRFNEQDFEDGETLMSNAQSKDEMAEMFRSNGMHPSRAADIILQGVRKKRTRIFIGLDAKMIDFAQRLLPMHYEKLLPFLLLPLTLLRNKKPLKGVA